MTPELGAEAEGKTIVLTFDYAPWNDEDKTTTDRPILTIYKVEGDVETEIIKYTEEFDTSALPCALKTFTVEIPDATADTRIKFWPDNHAEAGNGSRANSALCFEFLLLSRSIVSFFGSFCLTLGANQKRTLYSSGFY